jgi:hypothetical protein
MATPSPALKESCPANQTRLSTLWKCLDDVEQALSSSRGFNSLLIETLDVNSQDESIMSERYVCDISMLSHLVVQHLDSQFKRAWDAFNSYRRALAEDGGTQPSSPPETGGQA